MSWLADLLHPQPRRPMTIEVAAAESTASPAPAPTNAPELAAVGIEPVHPRLYSADPLHAEEAERHLETTADPKLQGLAQRVAAAKSRLLDLRAAAECLSMAADAAHYTGCSVESWLQVELAEVLAQIEQAEAGRKRADARRVARSERVTPLRTAVAEMHTRLVRERDLISDRAHLLRKGSGINAAPAQLLRQAGLTSEQIASLGQINQGEKELAEYTGRLEVIAPLIVQIERWHASGYRDHDHLRGLGFGALIESAQPVGEEAAP